MLYHHSAAVRAGFVKRLVPGGVIAVRISFAAIEDLAGFALAFEDIGAALRTFYTNRVQNGFGIAAFGEVGASQELAEAPLADNHHGAVVALVAGNVGYLERDFNDRNCHACVVQILFEGTIEFAEDLVLGVLLLSNLIQLFLHLGSEADVDESLEIFGEHIHGHNAKLGNEQLFGLFDNVTAGKQCNDGRCKGAGAADALLLQLLDERCFGEVRRRLGEVLLCGHELVKQQLVARFDVRNLGVLFFIVIFAVQLQEAREFQYGACCAQLVVSSINRQCGAVIYSVGHLAGNNAVPDERIQLQLVAGEVLLHLGRGTQNAGRTNRLMRVLRILFGAVMVGLGRTELAAKILLDIVADFVNGYVCQTHGVGSHIGNKADGGFAQRYAFIKLLCEHHGLFGAEVELFVGLLLHGGGSKRRYGVTLAFFFYCVAHDIISLGECFLRCSCLLLIVQLQLFALIFYCFRLKELALAAFTQLGAECPVFYRHEIFDFTVAVGNNFSCNGLYAAGAEALADFAPQQRA